MQSGQGETGDRNAQKDRRQRASGGAGASVQWTVAEAARTYTHMATATSAVSEWEVVVPVIEVDRWPLKWRRLEQ